MRPLHPFPARMAPELALERLSCLRVGSTVLDPMTGSGTVVYQACVAGHRAIGIDTDPLAVMMSRIATASVDDGEVEKLAKRILVAASNAENDVELPWIDDDPETSNFVDYWFAERQKFELRRLAHALASYETERPGALALDVLRLAMSRLIIVKENGASLARDTAHSRPHRVSEESDFDVLGSFERSVAWVRQRLRERTVRATADVSLGDCRRLRLQDSSIDAIVTSPPYLNAIDYMRGHRMSLVWFGHRLSTLREIRAEAVGTERGLEVKNASPIRAAMGEVDTLPSRQQRMIDRYVRDLGKITRETARVLATNGEATFVIGNSCLRGVFIRNADALVAAGALAGLRVVERFDRDLPAQHRYLPLSAGPLAKRMRTETIVSFKHS